MWLLAMLIMRCKTSAQTALYCVREKEKENNLRLNLLL